MQQHSAERNKYCLYLIMYYKNTFPNVMRRSCNDFFSSSMGSNSISQPSLKSMQLRRLSFDGGRVWFQLPKINNQSSLKREKKNLCHLTVLSSITSLADTHIVHCQAPPAKLRSIFYFISKLASSFFLLIFNFPHRSEFETRAQQ